MHSMPGLGREAQIKSYIQYSMYTHTLVLWITCYQFFRKFVCDATLRESFGSGLTAVNEVHQRVFFILDDIYIFFY